jgi:hypothetical protein
MGRQVVGAAEFVAEPLIVLGRKRPWQILGARREVLGADEVGRDGVAIGGQILQQTAQAQQIVGAGFQRRILFTHRAKPAGSGRGRPCAGINRHVVEDERALQERSSDSILTSSLALFLPSRGGRRSVDRGIDGLGD